MKLTDLVIDPHSLGGEFLLVDVLPAYEYTNGQRTEKIVGYRYTIVLPERRFEKINVRIDGGKCMDKPKDFSHVEFQNLEVFIYWSQGQPQVGARAKGIHPVQDKP
ncbi:MAG: hypothetical protein MR419_06940 [Clostridiales bacterium]|nr:hypothetical protein [Clostridiales bacterium]MDY4171732.1 hypothetical protein [Evtepia sp.]